MSEIGTFVLLFCIGGILIYGACKRVRVFDVFFRRSKRKHILRRLRPAGLRRAAARRTDAYGERCFGRAYRCAFSPAFQAWVSRRGAAALYFIADLRQRIIKRISKLADDLWRGLFYRAHSLGDRGIDRNHILHRYGILRCGRRQKNSAHGALRTVCRWDQLFAVCRFVRLFFD